MKRNLTRPILFLIGIGFLVLCAYPWPTNVVLHRWYWRIGPALVGVTLIFIGVIYHDIRARSGSLPSRARAALIIYGIVAGLIVAEAGIRILKKFPSPIIYNSPRGQEGGAMRWDLLLGQRPAPYVDGQDANGFRNASAPQQADMVVLGDSQTWGLNALRDEAWPQVLGSLSGKSIYNMGVSGYGPAEYWSLSDKALSFSPQTLVVGVYLGNDIWDAFHMIYGHPEYSQYQRPEIAPQLRGDRTQSDFLDFLDQMGQREGHDNPLEWLRTNFSLAGLAIPEQDHFQTDRAWVQENPDQGAVYENGDTRVILIPGPMTPGLDLQQPRIVEGQRLTEVILSQLRDKAKAANARLLVIIIPTKEMVYSSLIGGGLRAAYSLYVSNESQVRQNLMDYLRSNGIAYADALPGLQAAAGRNAALYTDSMDGHPVAGGYALIAQAAYQALSSMGN